jgi:small subunit ribosomal protein S10e
MLVPKKNRLAIYSYLFKEGVLVVKKDQFQPKHKNVEVPNLHVLKLMLSLKSRALVKEQFNWQYLYYTLTDTGIEYLRQYLHVSADTVPATLKKSTKPQPPPSFGRQRFEDEARRGGRGGAGFRGRGGFGEGRGGSGGGRDGYRGPKKFDGAPGDFNPSFDGEGRGGGRGGRGGRGGFRGGRGGRGGAAAGAPES